MKILMTTDTAGGVWHYAIDLASCLLEEEIEVALIAMGPMPNTAQLSQLKKCRKKGLTFYHRPYQLEWMDDPWEDVAEAGDWIKAIYYKEKPDLMHFNNYAQVGLGWDVPTVLVAHSCVSSWWHAVKKEPLPRQYDYYFEMVKKAFLTADLVVAPSKALMEIYHHLYGRINNPHVVYNGLSNAIIESSTKKPILFSMGRLWDEAKNIDLLLRAAPQIAGEIFIAGVKAKNFPCPENVRFLGELNRQQIFNWLKLSSIYVLPVKYEPFGLSFLEAASCRCALIGGDIPTLREIWGGSMIFIDPEDPKELARSCNELLMDQDQNETRGEEAFQKAKTYTLIKKKEQYLKIYGDLLDHVPETNNGDLSKCVSRI
ncbi:MAG: glycosyltransferase family 4 protein [Anditalea sp.]